MTGKKELKTLMLLSLRDETLLYVLLIHVHIHTYMYEAYYSTYFSIIIEIRVILPTIGLYIILSDIFVVHNSIIFTIPPFSYE